MQDMPLIPVSWGELVDKVTILEIKRSRLTSEAALRNVDTELSQLQAILDRQLPMTDKLAALRDSLREVNAALWDIEEGIRKKESRAQFDSAFIELARSVYLTNDRRSGLKREINTLTGSILIEEKSY